jgi:hypothetical protein
MQGLLTFFTGLLAGLLVAAAGVYFRNLSDTRKRQDELLFQIYTQLIELSGSHFWILSQELRGEQSNPERARRFSSVRWRIADLLRQADGLPEMREILSVMFSARFASERERAQELNRLVSLIGDRVNSRYNKAIREIDAENQKLMMQDMNEYYRRQERLEG